MALRPFTYARVRPSELTRRAITSSSASPASRSPSSSRSARREVERTLDVRLGCARPDDARARLAAEQQVERMRQHRLAGARLAGEHVEPGREAQLGPLDQQEVLDAQLVQHARGSTSRCRRIRRDCANRHTFVTVSGTAPRTRSA